MNVTGHVTGHIIVHLRNFVNGFRDLIFRLISVLCYMNGITSAREMRCYHIWREIIPERLNRRLLKPGRGHLGHRVGELELGVCPTEKGRERDPDIPDGLWR